MSPKVPSLLYGTAWKEEATSSLVTQALQAGFRGIDTANQRRHYHEAGVGEAVKAAVAGGLERDDLFLQTKFTYIAGQDHRLPYDPKASPAKQVEQSLASSLEHLGTDHLDAYLLHGPSQGEGLSELDWTTWRAMEELQKAGRTSLIGVSNVTARQLQELHAGAKVKPSIVQNRCFTRPHADIAIRDFCLQNKMTYEGFSLLTAITPVLRLPAVTEAATVQAKTPAQIILRYCLQRGMVVLTGTTDPRHMEQDLAIQAFELDAKEMAGIDRLLS